MKYLEANLSAVATGKFKYCTTHVYDTENGQLAPITQFWLIPVPHALSPSPTCTVNISVHRFYPSHRFPFVFHPVFSFI
jgi:hypothetical protein